MRRLLFLLAASVCSGVAFAQISVISPRADATSVTIYREGMALITETRTVDLPAEPVTVVFQGVVDSLLAQSAVMTGAERPFASTDFSFDQLTPATLLQRSVGKTVTLVRTNRKTGRVTRTDVTIVSVGEGVVLQSVDGSEALRCDGTPEHLELSEIPSELNPKPVLSARLAAGVAGKREIKLSYLAHGFSWSSDYVARLNDAANRVALTGWVTLTNSTQSSFKQAQVQVVAGQLNLVPEYEGGSDGNGESAAERISKANQEVSLLSRCFPRETTTSNLPRERTLPLLRRSRESFAATPMSVVVTAARRATRESLGDYQLYRIPEPTDLAARQTKQVVFLAKPAVKVERFYSVRVQDESYSDGVPNLVLRWENKKREGLGEPLPSGTVRVFEPRQGSEVFAGEAAIQDTPVGLPNELAIARAMNLTSEYTVKRDDDGRVGGLQHVTLKALHQFTNNKEAPVNIEVRHSGSEGDSSPVVVKSSKRAGKKYGDLAWRFVIPPGTRESLSYELSTTEIP